MSTDPNLPDLDSDTLTYKFVDKVYNGPNKVHPTYTIRRSINGGPFRSIGYVTRQHEARHPGDRSEWVAVGIDNPDVRAVNYTREDAAKSLEYRLQGPEYDARKKAEFAARVQADKDARHRANQAMVERLYALIPRFPYLEPALSKAAAFAAEGKSDQQRFSTLDLAVILESVRLEEQS